MMVNVYEIQKGGGEALRERCMLRHVYPGKLLEQAFAVAEMDEYGEHIDTDRMIRIRPVE